MGTPTTGPRTRFNSSRLIRLLSDLDGVDFEDSKLTLAERLGLWMTWTDAIALSAALQQVPGAAATPAASLAGADSPSALQVVLNGCTRTRQDLSRAISQDVALARPAAGTSRVLGLDTDEAEAGFGPWLRRYQAHQRSMDSRIGQERLRLREVLAQQGGAAARLAALDAVLDTALLARERQMLAAVPHMLQRHFEHRYGPASAGAAAANVAANVAAAAFGPELQAVLLAELDLRWQPLAGLIEALGPEQARH